MWICEWWLMGVSSYNAQCSAAELIVMFNLKNVLGARVKYVLGQICAKAIFPKMHKSGKLSWTHICAGAENAQIWKTEHLLIWGRLPSCSADSTTWLWIPPSTQNTRNEYFSWVYFQIIRILKSKILSWAYSPRGHPFRNTRKEKFSCVYYFLNYTISYYVLGKLLSCHTHLPEDTTVLVLIQKTTIGR